MTDRIRIYLTKMIWDISSVPSYKANYYSDLTPITEEEIEATNYLKDMGTLNYDFVDFEQGQTSFYYTVGTINLKFLGIVNNNYLQDFFGLKTPVNANTITKYYTKIYYNNSKVFTGIIQQNTLEINFDNDIYNTETISCKTTSLEKEFKEYFSGVNETLVSLNGWSYNTGYEGFGLEVGLNGYEPNGYLPLRTILENNFDLDIELDDDIEKWKAVMNPTKLYDVWTTWKSYDFKVGYQNFIRQGVNKYEYLNTLCLNMGWKLLVTEDSIKISNRAYQGNIQTLNTNLIKEFIKSYQTSKSFFDNIMVGNVENYLGKNTYSTEYGEFRGRNSTYVLSLNKTPTKGDVYTYFVLHAAPRHIQGWEFDFYTSDNDDYINYSTHFWGIDWPGMSYSTTNSSLIKEKTLVLPYKNSGDNVRRKDTSNGKFSWWQKSLGAFGDYDWWWDGNVSGMLMKEKTYNVAGYNLIYNFDKYVSEGNLLNNYKPILKNSMLDSIDLTYNDVNMNITDIINITSDAGEYLTNKNWVINTVEIDFINNETKYSLFHSTN